MEVTGNPAVQSLIDLALAEDVSRGDITTDATISPAIRATGHYVAREEMVICGLEVAAAVCQRIGGTALNFEPKLNAGTEVAAHTRLATVTGPAHLILKAERVSLNFLQRLSGIATRAKAYADAVLDYDTIVCDTRKTTPGWRYLEKQAVRAGGAHNHRFDLSGGVLIKDNHIVAAGGVTNAVRSARALAPHGLKIEVEVKSREEFDEALAAAADIVLLDNMSPEEIAPLVTIAHKKGVLIEVSGGITLATIEAFAKTGADVVSSGALTHSVRAADIALDFAT